MIPRAGMGSTPVRAEAYYNYDKDINEERYRSIAMEYAMHDKGERTSHRVGWTYTHNLGTDDPHGAFAEMAWTIEHQADLKRAAGIPATGAKVKNPIYPFSLSWHPDQRPSMKEMIAAGLSALRALKMFDRQVYFVEHKDTKHPHFHMIVNRVHPQTGLAHLRRFDRLALSRWAERYEKEHGKVFCLQREKNNAERAVAKTEKAQGKRKHAIVKDTTSMTRRQWEKLRDQARFKDRLPNINADVVRDQAEAQKRQLDTPEQEAKLFEVAKQQVLSGKDTLVFKPKGMKTGKSEKKMLAEIEQQAGVLKAHEKAKIDHATAKKIDGMQPEEWKQKLAKQLGPNETKAWFRDATFADGELTLPDRFYADYVKQNYAKGVDAALGPVTIKHLDRPAAARAKFDGPVADPRAAAFAEWEIASRNALQDRQNHERGELGGRQQRQRMKSQERIERQYGQDRRDVTQALATAKGQDREHLQKSLENIDTRVQEMLGADNRQFEAAWLDLNAQHTEQSLALDLQVSNGMSAGWEIPSRGATPGIDAGVDRGADPGWGRG